MAHYASDCWDAEIFTSYGWIECVGNADRACYDLGVHEIASGESMTVFVPFSDGPRDVEVMELVVNKGLIGSHFRAKGKKALQWLEQNKENMEVVEELKQRFEDDGTLEIEGITLDNTMIEFVPKKIKISGRTFLPSVIEPAFGLGRIIYSLLEHAYFTREEDDSRGVLSLKPIIAPYKASILPLTSDDKLIALVPRLVTLLTQNRISHKVDVSGVSIGRRYSRMDEIGCPFGITIDHQTLVDDTVTLRERDTTEQVRIPIEMVPELLENLIDEETTWADVTEKYPKQNQN